MIKVVNYIDHETFKIHIDVYDVEEGSNSTDDIFVNAIDNGIISVKRIPSARWNNRKLIRKEILSDRY